MLYGDKLNLTAFNFAYSISLFQCLCLERDWYGIFFDICFVRWLILAPQVTLYFFIFATILISFVLSQTLFSLIGTLTHGVFQYCIPWTTIATDLIKSFQLSERSQTPNHPDHIHELKRWIGKDLFQKYEDHKTRHIVRYKTPGMSFYRPIVTEVVTKFPWSFKVIVNGEEIDDGHDSFLDIFSHFMEHMGRRVPAVPRRVPQARLARGAVGVLANMHNPVIVEQEEQVRAKTRLKEIYQTVRPNNWPTLEIDRLMHVSYALQRNDILHVENNGTEDNAEHLDDPDGKINNKTII